MFFQSFFYDFRLSASDTFTEQRRVRGKTIFCVLKWKSFIDFMHEKKKGKIFMLVRLWTVVVTQESIFKRSFTSNVSFHPNFGLKVMIKINTYFLFMILKNSMKYWCMYCILNYHNRILDLSIYFGDMESFCL